MNDQANVAKIKEWRLSPVAFIRDVWGLTPQPVRSEYQDVVDILIRNGQWREVKAEHFEKFEKGQITWQQWLLLKAVERGLTGQAPKKVSVVSGHGVGKMHPYNTVVPTPEGNKRWGDLNIGDSVFGVNGKPTRIIV